MTTTQHPLTETAAAELWDARMYSPWAELAKIDRRDALAPLRAAFDAGREHERAQARPVEITDEMVEAATKAHWSETETVLDWDDCGPFMQGLMRRGARAALSAALAIAAAADPRHDPRPWQDCTREDVRKGDLVKMRLLDIVRVGIAHDGDEDGDWYTENGTVLTNGDRWPLRRIPAPTEKDTNMTETTPAAPSEPLARTLLGVPAGHGAPHHDASRIKVGDYVMQLDMGGYIRGGKAHRQDAFGNWGDEEGQDITRGGRRSAHPEALTVWPAPTPPAVEVEIEVEMPGEPRLLADVVLSGGEKIAEATWTGTVLLYARYPLATNLVVAPADQIDWWTLDGTRARRDGDHEDGTPRFVECGEGEK